MAVSYRKGPRNVRTPMNSKATQERVKAVLRYAPDTGEFHWLASMGGRARAGDRAGVVNKKNLRRYIMVDQVRYLAYRLAWLYMTGKWPTGVIDHINGDQSDDRFVNLRDATMSMNAQNMRKPSAKNKTGYLGVSKSRSKYMAAIYYAGKSRNLGRFDTPEEASHAYLAAKRQIHKGCTI